MFPLRGYLVPGGAEISGKSFRAGVLCYLPRPGCVAWEHQGPSPPFPYPPSPPLTQCTVCRCLSPCVPPHLLAHPRVLSSSHVSSACFCTSLHPSSLRLLRPLHSHGLLVSHLHVSVPPCQPVPMSSSHHTFRVGFTMALLCQQRKPTRSPCPQAPSWPGVVLLPGLAQGHLSELVSQASKDTHRRQKEGIGV